MPGNVVPWFGSQGSRAGDTEPGPVRRADLRPGFETLIASLPERFRQAAGRLVSELIGTADGPEAAFGDPLDDPAVDWHAGLELREAWAIARTFREAIDALPVQRGPDDVDATSLHAELDRSLLAAALANLDHMTVAHRRMVQDISHDIRSPLNSILFLADALRSERSGPLSEVQRRQVDVLFTAAGTLVRMANDLIDFSRLGGGWERISVASVSFSLESVTTDITSLLGPLTTHRAVDFDTLVDAEGLRLGDPRLLSRVLLNLCSNALEAVDSGGKVELRFTDTEDGDLRIEIGDDRTGTDVEMLRRLLNITEDEWPGETRGWTRGLGLTISARLVNAAGGRISILDRGGSGTVMRVDLPFPTL